MPRLAGIQERLGRGYYATRTIEPGQRVSFLFENDRDDHDFYWMGVAVRLLGFTRDEELRRLDYMMVQLRATHVVRKAVSLEEKQARYANGDSWEERWGLDERSYNGYPGSMCQEPHLLKLPRTIVIPKRREAESPRGSMGIEIEYASGHDLGAVVARAELFGMESRDIEPK